ncbi:MAG: DUF2318 domain-containing protein [Pseudomonadota bacterium]
MSKNRQKKVKETSALEKSAEKRAMILETKKKSRLPWVLVASVCALVLAAGALFATQKTEKKIMVDNSPNATVSASTVTYPVALFSDGKARHFRYEADGGITIQYFILKSSDGVIRAAFDACDVCWSAGKGYQQSGDVMVCRNCGRKFESIRVNEVKGGCNPAPLRRNIEGEKIVLQVEEILSGEKFFDFSNRG